MPSGILNHYPISNLFSGVQTFPSSTVPRQSILSYPDNGAVGAASPCDYPETDVPGRRNIRQSLRQPLDGAAAEISASLPLAGRACAGLDSAEVFRRRARPLSHQGGD